MTRARNENNQVIGFEKVTIPAGKFRAMKAGGTIDSFPGNSLMDNPAPGAFSTTTLKQ